MTSETGKEPKMAALYARVSSDRQDTDLSLSAQLRALREYATRNGHQVVREFVDEAESGRSANRPAFREMIALARAKEPAFNAILVWKLNRFARSRVDSVTFKTLLRKQGIEVISINEPMDDSPTGRLIEGVIESIDQFYSENLGQDIRRGMRENASRGFFNGSRPPYGFRVVEVKDGGRVRHKVAPEPEDSPAVQVLRRMYDMVLGGVGCKGIAKALNHEGVRTAGGQRWGRVTVHKVLTNEANCGTLVFGSRAGETAVRNGLAPVRVENAWPGVVSKETFQLVREKMGERRPAMVHPRTVPSNYLLSGMLFCSCGHAMTGHKAKSGKNFYYLCQRKYKQGNESCSARMVPKEKLEKAVVAQLRREVLTDENIEELVCLVNEELRSSSGLLREKVEVIDAEMHDVKARLGKLYDALETGKLEMDDLAPRIRELKQRIEGLSRSRVQAEADMVLRGLEPLDLSAVKARAKEMQAMLQKTEITERKGFLRSFIKRIEVDKTKVTIFYHLPLTVDGSGADKTVLPIATLGGPCGARTRYLLTASQA
ncbi:MAG: recombinase family protein, partial [Dehalococcoidia bacterium]|nr:recombinase family protein [Dehalococcoidia bacterium]